MCFIHETHLLNKESLQLLLERQLLHINNHMARHSTQTLSEVLGWIFVGKHCDPITYLIGTGIIKHFVDSAFDFDGKVSLE